MKVAIAGYGVEGQSNYRYWSALGAEIKIFDENTDIANDIPNGVQSELGDGVFQNISGFDLVVRTASLNPSHIHTDGKIWSSTNEFFKQCPAPIIGVTGTKGKGTTCSLIAAILKNAGHTVHLLGNIGVPALDILPYISEDDIVVFELSSFQLWDLEKSPQTAVVLMIEADHQDVHASMEEYVQAKANIARHQDDDDVIIYHPENTFAAEISSQSPSRHKKQYMKLSGAHIVANQIIIGDVAVAEVDEVGLVGEHNLQNICAAITAAWQYDPGVTAVQRAIREFTGLPHRLEFVREKDGVKYYNDSYSSAPGATAAAIKSFTQPIILICGGFDRGLDYSQLATTVAEASNIKKVLLIGQTKQRVADEFTKISFTNFEILQTDEFIDIISSARSFATPGDVVVLSPGCASFDMFKNFQDRGEQFKQIVQEF
ncbi:MAG: UDP-N-acetylmuramoylalanine--D-glutamate ligase [Patescibacteria group bacterium]|jgi:UDP-N-acetylmuramoylalanine--D-glutamate ligase|nr:UDP-N-acetylmuramoylalanine--D-glutamate ligase [Patescibacteria group bacterium]